MTTDERKRLRELERENRTLKIEREILGKSRSHLRQGERDTMSAFRFIDAEKARFPVSPLCRVLGRLPCRLLRVPDPPARNART